VRALQKIGFALATIGFILPLTSWGQTSVCPIAVLSANPRAISAIRGSALRLTYRNDTDTTITAISFSVLTAGTKQKVLDLETRQPLEPGQTTGQQWGYTSLNVSASAVSQPTVWPHMVVFSDGTQWSDAGRIQCALASPDGNNTALQGTEPTTTQQSDTVTGPTSQNKTALASTTSTSTTYTAEKKLQLIHEGKASLYIFNTVPAGAGIAVDGKRVGATPLSVVVLKSIAPRDVYLYLDGYEIYHTTVDPDGSTIPVNITLKPLAGSK
jgi:hypothetical protein